MAEYEPIKDLRTRLVLHEHNVINAGGADYPGIDGENHNIWNVDIFKKKFKIKVMKQSPSHEGHANMEMEFDMLDIDSCFVNSIRRILLSEVPSMAIEKVYIRNNNSLIMDEVLAHRLGLVPLKADARMFEYYTPEEIKGGDPNDPPPPSEVDTIVFELKVECYKKKEQPGYHVEDLVNGTVRTSELKWKPCGSQDSTFSADPIRSVHDDIIIAKLRSKHAIDALCYAYKGVGKDHSKFSPVATASYRLLPEVTLLEKVKDEKAERLQQCFSPGTIEIKEEDGHKVAEVGSARYDSCSRNVFRHDDLKDSVQLTKKLDHFIFNIESVGAVTPDVLFSEACKVLQGKCIEFLDEMKRL